MSTILLDARTLSGGLGRELRAALAFDAKLSGLIGLSEVSPLPLYIIIEGKAMKDGETERECVCVCV